jgi:hypothetical protein
MSCPACEAKRRHTPEDWKHHPLAGHGSPGGNVWTCEEARLAHEEDVQRQVAEARKGDAQ